MDFAVYWDIDGTLLSAPPMRADLFWATIEKMGGRPVLPDQPRAGLTDRRVGELYLAAAGMDVGRVDEFLDVLDKESAAYYVLHPRMITPGANEAITDVMQRGWRQALLSGNTPSRIRTKLFTAGIDMQHFDMLTSASGGFVSERRLLGVQAREQSGDDTLIVVGDTVHDVEAAEAAEAHFIAVNADAEALAELADHAVAAVQSFQDPAFTQALDRIAASPGPGR